MYRKRGYIYQYTIILILTISIFLPILLTSFKISLNLEHHYDLQDEIGILQLQQYLALSYDLKLDHNEMTFMINDKQHTVKQSNDNLIMKPGTMFILHKIDNVNFYLNGDIIILKYQRDGYTYEKSVWKK